MSKDNLTQYLQQLRSFRDAQQDDEQDDQAKILAAFIQAITEHDAEQEGGSKSYADGDINSYAYALPSAGGAGGAAWHEHLHNHFKNMAGHFAAAHAHLKPHIGKIADAASRHYDTLRTGVSHASDHFRSHVMPHAQAHLGHLGTAVTHHLGRLAEAGKLRAHNYVGSFKRYRQNIATAKDMGSRIHEQFKAHMRRQGYAKVRGRHPGATTINSGLGIKRAFADGDVVEAEDITPDPDNEDEGEPEDSAAGLALASHMVTDNFSPDEVDNLAQPIDDDEDEEGTHSFASSRIRTIGEGMRKVASHPTAHTAASMGGEMALRGALGSKNSRTRIRAQALAHARGQVMTHIGRASTATLTPIATARVGASYLLEHRRNRLKGVGLTGRNNAFNASHYLHHHSQAVDALAKRHGVSRLTAAHSMAYTAAALHRPAKVMGKQNAEANRAHHRNLGHMAVIRHAAWQPRG